jgi:adenylate kinase family enzyme
MKPRRRIVVYGVTGSGKTTLGRRLAAALGLRHVELDSLFHGPDWTPTPPDEFIAKIQAALDASPEGWVVDGNYGTAREFLLPKADTVIWLRLPFLVSYLSMARRTFRRLFTREELWNGNRETLRLLLFDKESLLLWGIREHRPSQARVKAALTDIPHEAEVIEVRSRRDIDALVERLARERVGAGASWNRNLA